MSYNTVVGWLVIAVGCWPLGGIIWQLTNAFRSRSWTGRAQGTVIRRGQELLKFPGRRRHEGRAFQVSVVEYEYEVDGQLYRSGKVAFTPRRVGPGSQFSKLIAELEPGREIEVVYNESRPQEAVLYPGFEKLEIGSVLGSLVFAGIFIGTGLAVLLDEFG